MSITTPSLEKEEITKIITQINEFSKILEIPIKQLEKENQGTTLAFISKKLQTLITRQKKLKLQKEYQKSTELKNLHQNEEYKNLEKLLQKYEAEIRDHIRLEQQLKIYTEGLEEKINKITKKKIFIEEENNLLEENQKLLEKIQNLKKEKKNLKKII